MDFKAVLGKKMLLFDGAMGTRLQAKGLAAGELPETWNRKAPETVYEIHKSYA